MAADKRTDSELEGSDKKDVDKEDYDDNWRNIDGKDSKMESSESEWDSSSEDVSASKPNLKELLKKEKEKQGGHFDLDVDFDSSLTATETESHDVNGSIEKVEFNSLLFLMLI